jgi:murein DD-endopeptidase MepM/ murein hydrolase activator NlpD
VRWPSLAVAIAVGLAAAPARADREDAAGSALPAAAPGADLRTRVRVQLDAEAGSVRRAAEAVEVKRVARAEQRARRAAAAYKVLRAGAPMWAGAEVRMATARRRAAARHLLSRDRTEVALLEAEAAQLAAAGARLAGERAVAETIALPAAGALGWPAPGRVVAAVGNHVHAGSRATLSRRGIELEVAPGARAVAMADGVVRYAGPIRGLGTGVVVGHGPLVAVIGNLATTDVIAGATVTRGAPLGAAAGRRLYVEVRLALGPGGIPLDPATVLAPR